MKKILFLILVCVPNLAFAAQGILSVETKEFEATQSVELYIDTQGEEINAIEGKITFDPNIITIEEIVTGTSFVGAWVHEPKDTGGVISFSGIIPKGFNGVKGRVFSFYLDGKEDKETQITFSGKVYLNDGKGTVREIKETKEKFSVIALKTNEKTENLTGDTTPPRILQSVISQNEAMFEGEPFLVVHAKDDESGIEAYELALSADSIPPDQILNTKSLSWQVVANLSLLPEGFKEKYIYVKAVDKEGNAVAQVVGVPGQLSPQGSLHLLRKWWGLGIIILLAFGLVIGLRRLLRRNGLPSNNTI